MSDDPQRGRACPFCYQREHHDPSCREMFWNKSDGSGEPDYDHPRGHIIQSEIDRLNTKRDE